MILLGLIIALMISVVAFLIWQQRQRAVPDRIDLGLEQVSRRVGNRLSFRMPELGDADFFLEMSADPTAAEANGWDGHEAAVVRARFANTKAFKQLQQTELVAIDRATKTRVGTTTAASSSPVFPEARSIGIHVHPDHRNQGYGLEIMAMSIALLQSVPGPIVVGTRTTNIALQRIMNQLGYEAEPDTRAFAARDGKSYESYWYRCGADVHPPHGVADE